MRQSFFLSRPSLPPLVSPMLKTKVFAKIIQYSSFTFLLGAFQFPENICQGLCAAQFI